MPKVRFTQRTVEQAQAPVGRRDALLFDSDLTGFGLRLNESGSRTFFIQYRAQDGRVRRMPLGRFGVLTVDEARKEARRLLGLVAAGGDPVGARVAEAARVQAEVVARESQAAADALTVNVLIDRWAAGRAGDRRESYLDEAMRCVRRNLPAWLDRPAASIVPAEAALAIDTIAHQKGVIAANRTLAYTRAAYSWALRRQLVPTNPLKEIEGAGREQSRERVLSEVEIGAIWRACAALLPYEAGFVRLLILTLGRRGEVAAMRWSEVAPDLASWTLPRERAKNGRAHMVHLVPIAQEILKGLPRVASSPYVFPSTDPRKPFSRFSALKASIVTALDQAGDDVPDWRFHDFRRAGVSELAAQGVQPHVADRLLNHVTGTIQGVAAVYQRHAFEKERAAALDLWGAHVEAAASGGELPTNVVTLRA